MPSMRQIYEPVGTGVFAVDAKHVRERGLSHRPARGNQRGAERRRAGRMAQTHPRIGARAAVWLCTACVCVCGCASAPHPAGPSGPPPPAPESAGPAYDWHPLIVVPFGTLLKDMPLALDEVLMFRDAAGGGPADHGPAGPAVSGAPNDPASGDCFSMHGASPPQFLARRADSYLLCFEHDRLHRIEASVQLAQAEPLLGALCAQWLGRAQDTARTPDGCAGREGTVEWRVHTAQGLGSSATLSITLLDARPVPRE
jgi:hypothetical protein